MRLKEVLAVTHFKQLQIKMKEEKSLSDAEVATTTEVGYGDIANPAYDHAATKKLLRRLDWHIIPFMSLIYL